MRPKIGLWLVLGAVIAVVACAAAPELPPVPRYTPAQLASVQWRAVLVAGDGRLRVFDDAVASMADWLHQRGVGPDEIARLSATRRRSRGTARILHPGAISCTRSGT